MSSSGFCIASADTFLQQARLLVSRGIKVLQAAQAAYRGAKNTAKDLWLLLWHNIGPLSFWFGTMYAIALAQGELTRTHAHESGDRNAYPE